MDIELERLIAVIESDDTTDPLERVAAAATLKDQMETLGDELLDHFVKEARDQGFSWNQIGEALGVTRQAAQQRHGGGLLGRLVEGLRAGRFQRFTPRARAAVIAAQTVARERGHDVIGTEHVLLALYEIGERNLGRAALDRLGVDPAALASFVDDANPPTDATIRGHIRFGRDAKTALEQTLAAAVDHGHNYIGCEHLLLGIAAVDDGLGARALAAQDVTTAALLPVVVAVVREAAGGGSTTA
jgi:Clp amino terminal domain, pathogenicity island component